MNGPQEPREALTPAERGLHEHLEVLRLDAPPPPSSMVAQVVRAARWQRAVRRPLLAVGALAAAVLDGVRLLFGSPTGRS